MFNLHRIKDQSGFTLIELLAAIALFTLVTILGMSLMLGAQGSQQSIEKDIELQKHTNNLIMDMRQQHQDQIDTYGLTESNISIPVIPHEDIEITRLIINGTPIDNPVVIDDITTADDIQIDITTTIAGDDISDQHRENQIHTVFYGTSPHTITINP